MKMRYSVIRYVPSLVRDESLNIGVVLEAEGGSTMVRFLGALSRVRSAFPEVDMMTLRLTKDFFAEKYRAPRDYQVELPLMAGSLDKLVASNANTIVSLTRPRTTLADDPVAELARLYQLLVARSPLTPRPMSRVQFAPSELRNRLSRWLQARDLVGPSKYLAAFEVQGTVSRWTFDYGTRNGSVQALQSISLAAPFDVAMSRAALLSGQVDDLRGASSGGEEVQVLAITDKGDRDEPVNYLRHHGVEVVPLTDTPQLTARLHFQSPLSATIGSTAARLAT